MKLVNENFFFQITLDENKVTNIIIESPIVFERLVKELSEQISKDEGEWVLSIDSTPISIEKYSEIILNPFILDINNKRILGKLYEDIKKHVSQTELLIKWAEIHPKISEVIDLLIREFDYNLEYNEEVDMKDFFKMINLRFINYEVDSLERLIDYMSLHNSILGTKLFILVNMKSFYTQDRLELLYKQAFYKKYKLLLIENRDNQINSNYEIRYIIDKDCCVIEE